MYKIYYVFVVCFLILLADAAPLDKDSEARIIHNEYTIDEVGNYRYSFETSNGISREESGSFFNVGQPNQHVLIIGRYSYINTDGKKEMVEYSADENGYSIYAPKPEISMGVEYGGVPGAVLATLLG
ncbi:jg9514 [Pararge aegeria aegeria]|uniref:Jg9514 protein n=1 Tax=Pararge aegeria aegeria TaxID=348720 RepID=A0A8S4RK92_9NEOP|nr:jg9514 [Pararge aegeria aegeria]